MEEYEQTLNINSVNVGAKFIEAKVIKRELNSPFAKVKKHFL